MESEKRQQGKRRKSSAPLAEKYRPKTLGDVLDQDHVTGRLEEQVQAYKDGESNLPHLMFSGPPGVGKTSAAIALARDLYGESWRQYVLELNASSERGIDVVRGRIKDFARGTPMGEQFNIIVLDEADSLTNDAQAAMRRVMEDYSSVCRFVLCANYPNRIIWPIRDRCSQFTFSPISKEKGVKALAHICTEERWDADTAALEKVWALSRGSMRAALNTLQGVKPPITEDKIHGHDSLLRAREVLDTLKEGDKKGAETKLLQTLRGGVSHEEVFQGIFDAVEESGLAERAKDKVLFRLGSYEHRVLQGCSPEIQLRCFLRELSYMSKNGAE